ncbi:5'-nucleotidase C-terminal domain-containing protein [Jeotgalibacillus proteolyticus]|uniref:Multifunctional 2',3'-cyclic-nucleotide 2'-phosphodiesterase/5'-nucleotidase/3'-nucleotidase n=1 Tax=Jeotgalibacillus proteolyticus TaxID=2082395 RepID=A0A2S5GAP4_9BACL|nr:5'-nucleotidase C-terminal domain-containing protein [Jeotgalibacillus proteolyticus]PPA69984.1 multifunctional 2',3'-cyclic-nucleotide 2'-phosphodiesterase/5'-nucleotidase/3'-nucleotidase [Jeotgalibacillus proteolyticus]
MKKKMCTAAIASALTISMFGIPPQVSQAAEGVFDLSILHTNDTHASLDDVAKRVTLVNQLRADNPNNLLLDAGDVFSGSLYFNEFQGEADLKFMNLMKYDAMVFGNHEFDLGSSPDGHKALSEFVKGAEFPFVAANVDFSNDSLFDGLQSFTYSEEFNPGEIYNGIVKEVNGEKIGIFGLTTEETAGISSPESIEFTNYIEAAEEAVAEFEEMGINKIVALTHIGFNDSAEFDNDLLLAEAVEGIDIIVGGHTHSTLPNGEVYNGHEEPTVIVQAGSSNANLGQLDVSFDENGGIASYSAQLHPIEEAEDDAEALALLAPYAEKIKQVKEQSTGATAEVFLDGTRDLGGVRTSETNLGNLITDGMLSKAKSIDSDTVIAMQNGGGIRASIDKGDITVGEVLTVLPFGNDLAIMNITGAEIIQALEHSVKDYPRESGAFMHVSGMSFTFNPAAAAGSKVQDVYVVKGNEKTKLDPAANYKVATNVFTAKGGDNYTVFANAYNEGRVSEPGFMDYQMFIDHITSLDRVAPALESRIIPLTPFTDIPLNKWYRVYIEDLYFSGLIKGVNANSFAPDSSLTRSQAASLIVRSLGLNAESDAPFADLGRLPDATKAEIAAAYENGIIIGYKGNFMPQDKVTRGQFALMVYRAYNNAKDTTYAPENTNYFKDLSKVDAETLQAISMAYETGIVNGYGNDQFRPANSSTRAEAAKMISIFRNVVK